MIIIIIIIIIIIFNVIIVIVKKFIVYFIIIILFYFCLWGGGGGGRGRGWSMCKSKCGRNTIKNLSECKERDIYCFNYFMGISNYHVLFHK